MYKNLMFLAILLIVSMTSAFPNKTGIKDKPSGNFNPVMIIEHGKEILGLSDEQIIKIKSLWKAHEINTIKSKSDLELSEIDLQEAFEGNVTDKVKIDELCDKTSKIRNKILKEKIYLRIDIENILTKEQKNKLKNFHKAPLNPHNRENFNRPHNKKDEMHDFEK